jgi:hypothetical protein
LSDNVTPCFLSQRPKIDTLPTDLIDASTCVQAILTIGGVLLLFLILCWILSQFFLVLLF